MKEWLSAREIAAEALPDMPNDVSGVWRMAERLGWDTHPSFARKRAGRGGGMEYHLRILPVLAQVAYTQRHLVVAQPEPDLREAPEKPASSTPLSDRAARERDARLAIVNAYQRFTRDLGLGHATHVQVFTAKYNANTIAVDPWVRKAVPSISKRSLIRWKSAKRDGQADRLAYDPSKARKGTGVLDTANGGRVQTFILAQIADREHLCADDVRTMCLSVFGDTLKVVSNGVERVVPMPPVRTFQHTLKRLKVEKRVEIVKIANPDLYRSTMAPAGVGMLRHVTEPNQMWQIDASPMDALCTDGRHSIYACIDVATRRTVFLLSRTPRASAVALLIRKAVLAWGVPDLIKTDNGSDFVAQDTQRLFASLDIEIERSAAYSPEQKGHVERAIKTFQHKVGPLLPGFIGHSVADRKAIESRKSFAKRLGESEADTFCVELTAPELQKHVDDWADLVYQHRPHGGLKGETPFKAWMASRRSIRTVDERALDLLLMPVAGSNGQRIVSKRGIQIDHYYYMTPTILPGTAVLVRQDPNDMGRAYAFAQDGGAFLGEATCPELAGIHPQHFVQATKEKHKEILDERTRPIKAEMREFAKGPSRIERALEVARRNAPNVIPLPKRTEEHSTPQISAAIEAMGERINPSRELTPREAAEHRRMIEEMTAEDAAENRAFVEQKVADYHERVAQERVAGLPANVAKLPETPLERYRRAVRIDRQVKTGAPTDTFEAMWLGSYQTTAEYRAHAKLHEEHGDAYLS
ncbi:MAG: transposase [Rhizobiaceae bacterium]|nr:transposase [Rhizobiaceae bacterium]